MTVGTPLSVLRPVDNANPSVSLAPASTSGCPGVLTDCELRVYKWKVDAARAECLKLSTWSDPVVHTLVAKHLQVAGGRNRWLLDAWARCGRNDQGRSMDLRLSAAVAETVTPLGIACLISYCRAWLDSAEDALEEAQNRAGQPASGPPHGTPGRQDPAPKSVARPSRKGQAAVRKPGPVRRKQPPSRQG